MMGWLVYVVFMSAVWIAGWGLLEGDWWSTRTIVSGVLLGVSLATFQYWDTIEPRLRRFA